MENNALHELLDQCENLAEEEDLTIIRGLLEGVKQKLETKEGPYLAHILNVEKKVIGDSYELKMPISNLINNYLGVVHGGITATVMDTAMGMLIPEILPEGYAAVTSQLNIHYIAPGVGSELTCKAYFIHKGSKTMVMESEVYRDDGNKIAHATGTFVIVKK